MLLVITRISTAKDALARVAAAATGLALSDVALRLAGFWLPRVLLADVSADRIRALAGELDGAGYGTLCCDPADAPNDEQRVVARQLFFVGDGLAIHDRAGRRHLCPRTAVALIQRGTRVVMATEQVAASERRPALVAAVLTGGLVTGRSVVHSVERPAETREPFLVIQRTDGQPEFIFYERRLDYRFLQSARQSATPGNFALTVARVRGLFPRAGFDDRVAQPGYVKVMPTTIADPVDLALHLVKLVQLRPVSPYRS